MNANSDCMFVVLKYIECLKDSMKEVDHDDVLAVGPKSSASSIDEYHMDSVSKAHTIGDPSNTLGNRV
jgi:hypothetical protein